MRPTDPITAKRIATTDKELVMFLPDCKVRLPWQRCSARPAAATNEQRQHLERSPAGYGIHWLIDEDLSIGGLLGDAAARSST